MWLLLPYGALVLLALVSPISVQTGGQFCVRAFEDRNANQALDLGEPFLTRDVAAALLDADGVVIATALMDDSPTAAQGVICFQFLPPGQYSLQITSPLYAPTTSDTATAVIGAGTLPTVVEYGARRADTPPDAQPRVTRVGGLALPANEVVRAGLALLGALIVMGALGALGVLIYLLALRPQPAARAVPAYRSPTTGSSSMPPVGVVSDEYLADAIRLETDDKQP